MSVGDGQSGNFSNKRKKSNILQQFSSGVRQNRVSVEDWGCGIKTKYRKFGICSI